MPAPLAGQRRRREIPAQFLEQLVATLRRGGVLRSQRGVKGGYTLARAADEITVLEVVELLDGPLAAEGDDDAVGNDAETTTTDGAGVDREDDDVGIDSDVTMAEERVAAAKALAAAELSAAVKANRVVTF